MEDSLHLWCQALQILSFLRIGGQRRQSAPTSGCDLSEFSILLDLKFHVRNDLTRKFYTQSISNCPGPKGKSSACADKRAL